MKGNYHLMLEKSTAMMATLILRAELAHADSNHP
jgi:hypothetical protein